MIFTMFMVLLEALSGDCCSSLCFVHHHVLLGEKTCQLILDIRFNLHVGDRCTSIDFLFRYWEESVADSPLASLTIFLSLGGLLLLHHLFPKVSYRYLGEVLLWLLLKWLLITCPNACHVEQHSSRLDLLSCHIELPIFGY